MVIHGSLLDQIDRIIETVHLKYMKAKITYEGMHMIPLRQSSSLAKCAQNALSGCRVAAAGSCNSIAALFYGFHCINMTVTLSPPSPIFTLNFPL